MKATEVQLSKKADYVEIEASYGGNQGWFGDEAFGTGDLINFGGCGLIAMADLLLYLAPERPKLKKALPSLMTENVLSRASYHMFVENLFYTCLAPWRNPFFRPGHYQQAADFVLGIQGWQLKRGMAKFFKAHDITDETIAFVSVRKHKVELTRLLCQQLEANRPVPLLVGPTSEMFPKPLSFLGGLAPVNTHLAKDKRADSENQPLSGVVTPIASHWVTATGYYVDQATGNEWLTIASWGEKYYLDFTQFKQTRDWFSGVLVITQK